MLQLLHDQSIGIELCERLIESEIQDAVNATGGTALAAVGVGCILTFILPTTLEDILALAISFLIGNTPPSAPVSHVISRLCRSPEPPPSPRRNQIPRPKID